MNDSRSRLVEMRCPGAILDKYCIVAAKVRRNTTTFFNKREIVLRLIEPSSIPNDKYVTLIRVIAPSCNTLDTTVESRGNVTVAPPAAIMAIAAFWHLPLNDGTVAVISSSDAA